jgi:hypothetical protein
MTGSLRRASPLTTDLVTIALVKEVIPVEECIKKGAPEGAPVRMPYCGIMMI